MSGTTATAAAAATTTATTPTDLYADCDDIADP